METFLQDLRFAGRQLLNHPAFTFTAVLVLALTANPGQAGAAYGYPNKGGYQGAQTELLRVPFADANCLKLPGEPGDEWEDDFVLLADAFPTGYHATGIIGVSPSDTVVVFGAGAVGLLAAYSARLRGAARVYSVDAIPERLEKAGELGAIPINFLHGDPVEQILEQQSAWRSGPAFRQENALCGVTCAVDAIGFQARSRSNYEKEDPLWVTEAIADLINPAGRVAIVGVWPIRDPDAEVSALREGRLRVPWSKFFNKNVTIAMGRDDDKRWNAKLRDMIINGAAKPSLVVSDRLDLDQAPDAFAKFDARQDGYIKVILRPA